MPKYNPSDAINGGIIPAGTYEAVVKRADNKTAKSGSEMIQLILTVYGPEESDVFDNLVFHPKMMYRIQHFCDSAGIDFNKGELDANECVGRNVRVRLGIKDDEYGKANVVKDYTLRTSTSGAPVTVKNVDPIDAEIPF
jgi:hypothetical protein